MTFVQSEKSPDLLSRLLWQLRFIRTKPRRKLLAHNLANPLVVAGLFGTNSGIGLSARACVNALKHEGLDPLQIDLSPVFGQVDREFSASARRLPKKPGGTLILHLNAPETERALFEIGAFYRRNWRIIGYWAWELSQAPDSWLPVSRYLSEIWTPSDFVTNAFRGHVSCPVRTVPHFVNPPKADEMTDCEISGLDNFDGFSCLIMADGRSSFHRKNLMGSLSVFQQAFPDRRDVRLVIKSRNLREYPEFGVRLAERLRADPRIRLIDGNLSEQEKWALIERCDVTISAHRAEGFGLHLAEAMVLGRPVIATNWSGNLQYMSASTACLIDYSLTPVVDPHGVYSGLETAEWAEPNLEHAASMLKALAENPDKRKQLGEAASRHARELLTSRAYFRALAVGAD